MTKARALPKLDARRERIREEAGLLGEALDAVELELIKRDLWPSEGLPRPDRPDAMVSADSLFVAARTILNRASMKSEEDAP